MSQSTFIKETTTLRRETEEGFQDVPQKSFPDEKQVSLSPTSPIPFDILSLIFEFCSMADWRSPMRTSAVSRWWHEAILNTPSAWQFVDLRNVNQPISNIYIERSRHCLFHLYSALPASLALDSPDKIQCMTTAVLPYPLDNMGFPHPQRLCVTGMDPMDPRVVTVSTFPLLRHR